MTHVNIDQWPSPVGLLNFSINPAKLNARPGVLAKIISGMSGKQALENIFGNPLDSQTSFSQVEGGRLLTVVLISVERAYTEIRLLETINELSEFLFIQIKNRDKDNLVTLTPGIISAWGRTTMALSQPLRQPRTPASQVIY